MDLSAGFQPFLATLRKKGNAKVLRNIFRKQPAEREVGTVRFVYDSQDHAALRTVMAWKSAPNISGRAPRFAQRSFVDLSDRLFATTSEPFYPCSTPAMSRWRAFWGSWSDRVMAYWVPAFDRRYGPYSPGLILNLFLAEAAAGCGIEHVDLGTGAEEYKRWFETGALTVSQGRVARRSPAAALYSTRRASSNRVLQAVTGHPSLYRAAKRTRSTYFRMDAAVRRRKVGESRRGADRNDQQVKYRTYGAAQTSDSATRSPLRDDPGCIRAIQERASPRHSLIPSGGVGAQLGVHKGHLTPGLIEWLEPDTLYVVDPWYLLGPKWEWAAGDKSTVNALARTIRRIRPAIETWAGPRNSR